MTQNKKLGIWLLCVSLMVMIMTLIGAITRLTESGLSITEWNVVSGAIPPIGDAAWAEDFRNTRKRRNSSKSISG